MGLNLSILYHSHIFAYPITNLIHIGKARNAQTITSQVYYLLIYIVDYSEKKCLSRILNTRLYTKQQQ